MLGNVIRKLKAIFLPDELTPRKSAKPVMARRNPESQKATGHTPGCYPKRVVEVKFGDESRQIVEVHEQCFCLWADDWRYYIDPNCPVHKGK